MKANHFGKDFTLVVIGQIISLFGNAILRFALPLYLLRETNSPVLFGLVTACSFLPVIFLSFLGGILADRANKRNIMVILDFVTAGIILVLSLVLGHLPLVPLLLLLCSLSVGVMAVPLLLGLSPLVSYGVITATCFAIMGLATMFSVQMIAVVQTETPSELVGKVIALMMSVSLCAQPVGQAVYGVVFGWFPQHTGVILLCVAALSALIATASRKAFQGL